MNEEFNIKIDEIDIATNMIKQPEIIKIDCYIFYCMNDVCSSKTFSFNVNVNYNDNASEIAYCDFKYRIM